MGARVVRQSVDDGLFASIGEQIAAAQMERQLPDRWWIVCNKELHKGRDVREVDFIVIADKAVYVIDEKSFHGTIRGTASAWVLPSGESRRSPLDKACARARELAGHLRRDVPVLSDDEFVFGKVLLSSKDVLFRVNDQRSDTDILNLGDCGDKLKSQDKEMLRPAFSPSVRKGIIDVLCNLRFKPRVPARIGEYKIVHDLKVPDYAHHLSAEHDDGSLWLLKVIGKPLTADDAIYAEKRELLLREYRALQALEGTGRAPVATPYFSWNSGEYWIVPTKPISGISLETMGQNSRPNAEAAWRIVYAAFDALKDVHARGVLHRAITPDRIFVPANEQVCFDGFVIPRITGRATIAASAREVETETEFTSPECRKSVAYASETSDTYSLAASLLAWCGVDVRFPDRDVALAEGVGGVVDFLKSFMSDSETSRPTAVEALKAIDSMGPRLI
jgi:serine/threonine protein kinase